MRNRQCNKQTHVLSSVKVSFPPEDLLELFVCFCLFDNIFCLKCLISMSLLVLVPRLTGERNAADWNTEPILCCTSSKLAKLGSKIVIAFQEFVCLWKILKKWKKWYSLNHVFKLYKEKDCVILWGSGKGQARTARDVQLKAPKGHWKAIKLKPLPKA